MIKIALCDDESEWLEKHKAMILEYAQTFPQYQIQLTCFDNGSKVLNSVIMSGPFDIYILDVVMPNMTGIETGIRLRQYDQLGKIIYLTSSPDFGIDSYITGAFFYLLKPVTQAKLFEILNKATADISRRKEKAIKVKTADDIMLLHFDDIVYVELNRKALCYTLANGKRVESVSQRESFSQCVLPLTADNRFALAGTSMCINVFFVQSVGKDCVVLKDGTKLYLSKRACASLRSAWLDYWFDEGGNDHA